MENKMVNKLCAVMPVFNESPERLKQTILDALKYVDKIIVVNDGSEIEYDYECYDKSKVIFIRHTTNLGKGGALRTGCRYAFLTKAKHLLLIDSDGQHSPEDIPKLLEDYEGNEFILGYRVFNKEMPLTLKLGNLVINSILKVLFGMKVKDSQCGFKLFPISLLKKIMWSSQDYAAETEMLIKIAKNKFSYKEVPIKTIYEDAYKGAYIFDGIKIVYNMFIWRLLK